MSEQIFSHSSTLKIRLDFSEIDELSFQSIYAIFELLEGRELFFPPALRFCIEFEMLYVGELAILLAGMMNSSNLPEVTFDFSWTNGREQLRILPVEP
jgi:hypothetical protein